MNLSSSWRIFKDSKIGKRGSSEAFCEIYCKIFLYSPKIYYIFLIRCVIFAILYLLSPFFVFFPICSKFSGLLHNEMKLFEGRNILEEEN